MRALIAMVFATGLSAASLGAVAAPEATYAVKLLTPEAALTAAQAAMAHCRKAGHQVTVAVVDRSGVEPVARCWVPSAFRAHPGGDAHDACAPAGIEAIADSIEL